MKCKQCNKLLEGVDQKKFCSSSCAASYNNKGIRRNYNPDRWHECPECGTMTVNKRWCSQKCRDNHYASPEVILEIKAKRREGWYRYHAKRKNQTPHNVDIEELQRIYLKCPDGHEVDHIIPIDKGGLHSPENLQYLTIHENRKKSNKII